MKKYLATSLLSLTFIAAYAPTAYATSLAVTVDINAGCQGTVNGSSSITLPVESTQSSNITIFNQNYVSYQNVAGPGFSGSLANNNKVPTGEVVRTFNVGTITANTTITVTPVITQNTDAYIAGNNSCPPGSNPVPSTIILTPIKPASTPAPTTTKTTTPTPTAKTTATASTTATTPVVSSDSKDTSVTNSQTPSQPTQKKRNLTPIYIGAFVGAVAGAIAYVAQNKKKNTKQTKSMKKIKKSKTKK